jgi:hypothetical protein
MVSVPLIENQVMHAKAPRDVSQSLPNYREESAE